MADEGGGTGQAVPGEVHGGEHADHSAQQNTCNQSRKSTLSIPKNGYFGGQGASGTQTPMTLGAHSRHELQFDEYFVGVVSSSSSSFKWLRMGNSE